MDPDIKSSEVIFFFGAGASISAGVPDTYTFIDQYVEFLTEKSQKDTIKKIINTLVNKYS